jgi:hypothetical protein
MFTQGTAGTSSWPLTLNQFVPDWRVFESPFDKRTQPAVAPFPVSYGFNSLLYGTSTTQYNYPSQLIVLAGAPTAGVGFTGISSADVLLPTVLVGTSGSGGGAFRNGQQLNVLYSDLHVAVVLVSTYNDRASTTGLQQWTYNAPLPVLTP